MIDFDDLEEEEKLNGIDYDVVIASKKDEILEIEDAPQQVHIAFVDFWPGFDDNTDKWVSKRWFHENLLGIEEVDPLNDPEVVVFSLFGNKNIQIERRRRSKLVHYIGENVRPPLREVPLCLSFDHTPDVPLSVHTRLPIWVLNREVHDVIKMHSARISGEFDATVRHRKRFCSWVATNTSNYNASVRLKFVELLSSRYKEVACGGSALNNVGGPVKDKIAFLRGYKFNVCFENGSHPGYCTEKLLHAFAAGCVPIYWGDPRVARAALDDGGPEPDFNPSALITAHDFGTFEELVDHIARVDNDPKLFEEYLHQPILSDFWYKKLSNWSEFQRDLSNRILENAAQFRCEDDYVEDFAF